MGNLEFLPSVAGGFVDQVVHLDDAAGYFDNVRSSNVARDVRVRIYRPTSQRTTNTPVIIYFHGGGFVLGAIESVHHIATRLAVGTGCVVVNVDYRLGMYVCMYVCMYV